jgi:hypothetical protein
MHTRLEPRTLNEEETATLHDLAAVVMNDLELRLESRTTSNGASS